MTMKVNDASRPVSQPVPPTQTDLKKPIPQTNAWVGRIGEVFNSLHQEIKKPFDSFISKISYFSPSTQVETIKQRVLSLWCPKLVVEETLPIDPAVTIKRLENGLTYYVRHHAYPDSKKAYLRLVVNVGHLNETKEERGIAHLIEHITQLETKNFSKGAIDKYFESKGVAWGSDNNASTSPTNTEYKLDIPLDDPKILEETLFILSEVAFQATLSDALIDGEREIVIDELRQIRGLSNRYNQKILSVILEGTPYPNIFHTENEIKSVKACPTETIRQFYKRWYKSQNMAVVAVGDFDVKHVEGLIKKYFSKIPSSKEISVNNQHRPKECKEPRFICVSDPEATVSQITLLTKLPVKESGDKVSLKTVKNSLIHLLFEQMFNDRLEEIVEESDSILTANRTQSYLIPGVPYSQIKTLVKEGELVKGFKKLLIELKRVKEHGFLQSEFEMAKQDVSSTIEHQIKDIDKISGKKHLNRYLDHFLTKTPIPSLSTLLTSMQKIFPTISLKEINDWAKGMLPEDNYVVGTLIPEKTGLSVTEEELKSVVEDVKKEAVTPYEQTIDTRPLIAMLPTPGKILTTKTYEASKVIEYKLENGLNILVKPTTVDNKVTIYGYALRGYRDSSLKDRAAAKFANDLFDRCGLGDFDRISLNNVLRGKVVSFEANISNYMTTFKSNCIQNDLESSFQLLHLLFTNPGYTKEAFDLAYKETKEALRNRHNHPTRVFTDEVMAINGQNHPEYRPITLEHLQQIDYDTSKNFHQESYRNPADFTIVIAGNIEQKEIKRLIELYMASVPKIKEKREEFNYSSIPFPSGIVKKEVYAGIEPACTTIFSFPAPTPHSQYSSRLSAWSCYLVNLRLTEVLRKQLGKTYSPACTFSNTAHPKTHVGSPSMALIEMTTDPTNLKEMEESVLKEIKRLQEEGPTEQEVSDLKTLAKRLHNENFNSCAGWRDSLYLKTFWGVNVDQLEDFEKHLETLNPNLIKEEIKKIFPLDNYTMVTLLPKKEEIQNI